MDWLKELDGAGCYFEESLPDEVAQLLDAAAEQYGEAQAELLLLRAFLRAPDSLSVMVSLYRYYFYQHRLKDALLVAERAIGASADRLGFGCDWPELAMTDLEKRESGSATMTRFYLFALKGAGYLNMRIGNVELGTAMLRKVRELDPADRLGASVLLNVVDYQQGLKLVES